MKVAILPHPGNPVPPKNLGAIARIVDEASRELANLDDIDVTVCSTARGSMPREEIVDGVHHIQVPVSRVDEKVLAHLSRLLRRVRERGVYSDYVYQPYYYLVQTLRMAWQLRRGKYDIIQFYNFSQMVPIIKFFNPHSKIVLDMQCEWLTELDDRKAIRCRLDKVDLILGCSNYIIQTITQTFPEWQGRSHTVYNATNHHDFSPRGEDEVATLRQRYAIATDEKVVLYVGRLNFEKGVHVLIEAMHTVLADYPQARLMILGPSAMIPPSLDRRFAGINDSRAQYLNHLKELSADIEERIVFTGFVPHPDLPAYYTLADVFVHPCVWNEPFGMTVTEAMACETPVIASQVGGIPEIIEDGISGLLVPPGDVEALAQNILRLLKDDDLRCQMGRHARKRVEDRFTWKHVAQELANCYQALL